MKNLMRVFSVVLLVMVGTVFAVGPAGLIVTLFAQGGIGIALAMIGVIVCPITSGDTAFRSARLTLADWFGMSQDKYKNRLILCIPLLAAGALIGHLDYTVVWRYFSWTNQTLAMIVLWTASMYLFRTGKNYWLTTVPATFMSAVSMTYLFCAPECFGLSTTITYPAGIILAAFFLGIFIYAIRKSLRRPSADTAARREQDDDLQTDRTELVRPSGRPASIRQEKLRQIRALRCRGKSALHGRTVAGQEILCPLLRRIAEEHRI